jgi:hypothetical protein
VKLLPGGTLKFIPRCIETTSLLVFASRNGGISATDTLMVMSSRRDLNAIRAMRVLDLDQQEWEFKWLKQETSKLRHKSI